MPYSIRVPHDAAMELLRNDHAHLPGAARADGATVNTVIEVVDVTASLITIVLAGASLPDLIRSLTRDHPPGAGVVLRVTVDDQTTHVNVTAADATSIDVAVNTTRKALED